MTASWGADLGVTWAVLLLHQLDVLRCLGESDSATLTMRARAESESQCVGPNAATQKVDRLVRHVLAPLSDRELADFVARTERIVEGAQPFAHVPHAGAGQ